MRTDTGTPASSVVPPPGLAPGTAFSFVAAGPSDFGELAEVFTVENIYEEDAHIERVASSCGCITATVDKPSLKTWEKAKITAKTRPRGQSSPIDLSKAVAKFENTQLPMRLNPTTREYFRRMAEIVEPKTREFGLPERALHRLHDVRRIVRRAGCRAEDP